MGGRDAVLYLRRLHLFFPAGRLHPAKSGRKNGPFSDLTDYFISRLCIYFDPLCDGFPLIDIKAEGLPQPLHHFSSILYPRKCNFSFYDPLGIFYILWNYRKHLYVINCMVCLEMA